MRQLKVISDTMACTTCSATQQMKASNCCSSTIINFNGQLTPECFINMKDVPQEERNYLMCPTYNLGIYSVCDTCPLDCVKNPNKKRASSLNDVLGLLSGMFGIDENKKKQLNVAFDKLKQPEFKEVYTSLEQASWVIKDVMSGKLGSSDVARKVLSTEAVKLKESFGNLVKDGKITEEEARMFNAQINTEENLQKLKSILSVMKAQSHEQKKT